MEIPLDLISFLRIGIKSAARVRKVWDVLEEMRSSKSPRRMGEGLNGKRGYGQITRHQEGTIGIHGQEFNTSQCGFLHFCCHIQLQQGHTGASMISPSK